MGTTEPDLSECAAQPDMLRRALLGLPLLMAWPAAAAEAHYVIARPDESPSPLMQDIERRVLDAYRRIGVVAEVQSLPARRSAAYAQRDKVDAELLRVQLAAPRNNFLRVDTPLVDFSVLALCHGHDLALTGPPALSPYRVGILVGIQALEDAASRAGSVEAAPDYASALRMLQQDRVDVVLMLSADPATTQARHTSEWQGFDIRVANSQLARYTAYHFISPRHRRLQLPLAAALHASGLPLDRSAGLGVR